jgi:hypothetical protein
MVKTPAFFFLNMNEDLCRFVCVNNFITLSSISFERNAKLFCKNGGGVGIFFEKKLRFLCLYSASRERLNPKIV